MTVFTRWTTVKMVAASIGLGALCLSPANAKTVLTMSSWVPPTHFFYTDVFVPWAEKIEEATGGRVSVEILPAPLGSPPQHFELARTAVVDLAWGNFTYEPDRFVSLWFAEFPFAGTNAEAQSRALWRTYEEHLKNNAAFDGVKMLGVSLMGGGQLHHGSMTVTELDQMKDQKFRMGGPIQEQMLTAFGAVPVAAPAPKTYELLDSGVIDGSLNPIESVVNFRLMDSLTHHTFFPEGFYDATFFMVMNGDKWESLSEEDRKAIKSVSGEALSTVWGQQFDAQNAAARRMMEEQGHEIAEPSPTFLAELRTLTDQMIADWKEKAKAAGIANPEAVYEDYLSSYRELAGK